MKVQTAIRLDKDLIKELKQLAKESNRTLANYIETVLYKELRKPNQQTLDSLLEAREEKLEGYSDMDSLMQALEE